jgi:fibrillarin-like rRNA methylase
MNKFNKIINCDLSKENIPHTKKFTYSENNENSFRMWNPFKSTLSAGIICGLELIPINKNSSLLCIGDLHPDSYLNLLDLVENNQKICCITKSSSSVFEQENLSQFNDLSEIKNKFSVIYMNNHDYSYESIQKTTKSFLNNNGYLLITLSKSSINFDDIFKKLTHDFQIIQELNIESYFRNKSLLVCKLIDSN